MKLKTTIALTSILILLSSCSEKNLPTASFNLTPPYAEVGDIIEFQNTSEYAETYDWNFGDGYASTEENPRHTYAKDGEYVIHLLVSNENGSDEATMELSITPLSPCWDRIANINEPRATGPRLPT